MTKAGGPLSYKQKQRRAGRKTSRIEGYEAEFKRKRKLPLFSKFDPKKIKELWKKKCFFSDDETEAENSDASESGDGEDGARQPKAKKLRILGPALRENAAFQDVKEFISLLKDNMTPQEVNAVADRTLLRTYVPASVDQVDIPADLIGFTILK